MKQYTFCFSCSTTNNPYNAHSNPKNKASEFVASVRSFPPVHPLRITIFQFNELLIEIYKIALVLSSLQSICKITDKNSFFRTNFDLCLSHRCGAMVVMRPWPGSRRQELRPFSLCGKP